ncbi:type VI secretion-associated protein [Alkalilimnicola ehrlichii]|uniref:Type VI secretion-associated protein n=1 Tax=Alkalilimnicola ehrlichii TaxID=351052 RepID=A0A3E0WUD0_9GAMM|nr:type VI secretion system-associated protein TagF [Alkalilimnicola ehrlichii]RFA29850.1 type VI secretion-associated protein [Alkalilimnicola ehrlichii]RFA36438.1 type VI secretion-associated protein [Alkalilimnicola ehrlichii]
MFGFLKQNRAAAKPAKQAKQAKPVKPDSVEELVGCFGKLPIRADFIKYNVKQREVLAIDQWVQEGHALLSRRTALQGDKMYPEAPVQHCVFSGSADDRTVLATLIPSSDQSGRQYPFVIFDLPQPHWLAKRPAGIPLAYDTFFSGAADISRQQWRTEPFSTLTGCIDVLKGAGRAESPESLSAVEIDLLRETPVAAFHACLPGASVEQRAALIHTFVEALQQVVRRTPLRVTWGMRVPLPADPAQAKGVLVFWLRLIDGVIGPGQWRPNYFWSYATDTHKGGLTVFFRPVPAAYLGHCFQPDLRDGSVLDIEKEAAEGVSPSALAQRLAQMEEGHLLDFMFGFGGGGGS